MGISDNKEVESKSDYKRFTNDLVGVFSIHLTTLDNIKILINTSGMSNNAKELIEKQYYDLTTPIKIIEYAFNKFIKPVSTATLQQEIERQSYELFPDTEPNENQINYIKLKIIFEWLSSFMRLSSQAWTTLHEMLKILAVNSETKSIYDKIKDLHLSKIQALQEDAFGFLDRIKSIYNGGIVGSYKKDPEYLMSNLIYDELLNYDYSKILSESKEKQKTTTDDLINQIKTSIIDKSKKEEGTLYKSTATSKSVLESEEFYYTEVIGTKDWNKKDSYILYVKSADLKEEEKKFYSSSFVLLNPKENTNINLAAALVRQNNGYSFANKYSKMLQTLVEYAVGSLFTKDFINICDDTKTFLYHIGPIVLYNIIIEDLIRREFGHCYYVEKNSVIKLFPENIIKKHIIDYWAESFYDLKAIQVDSYINYSKGIQGVKDSYRYFFDQAAATRKRVFNETTTIEEYMRLNTGKFFGYRRALVYRRFIADSIFGQMPEVNSIELVKKFSSKIK